jgi:diaminopimelate decarboxylase
MVPPARRRLQRETVSVLLDTVAKVHQELGITFEFINIGGGLGIPYRPGQPGVDLARFAATVRGAVDEGIAKHRLPFLPRVCMENGRFLTGPFGWLAARCHVIKQGYAKYYGLDANMANLMRPGMYNAYHHITVPAREGGPRESANVVGQLCENNDWFAKVRPSRALTATSTEACARSCVMW